MRTTATVLVPQVARKIPMAIWVGQRHRLDGPPKYQAYETGR